MEDPRLRRMMQYGEYKLLRQALDIKDSESARRIVTFLKKSSPSEED